MITLRVGTRGSLLARTQTQQLVTALSAHHPALTFETVLIKTTGDMKQGVPFAAVGTKGMFVKEIEEALLAGEIDLAVHSLKDMPGEMPDGLMLGAMPRRADPRDALIVRADLPAAFVSLPVGARVGTSSLRRHVQIRETRPDLVVEELRGNLDTRLRKLDEGQYDAIVLACAGLERLGWQERITERLSPETSVPAPGQGALALEIRAGDTETRSLLLPLHDPATADAVTAERAFQAALQAGCSVPAGAFAVVEDETLHLTAMLATDDGSRVVREVARGTRRDAAQIGQRAAHALLRRLGEL